MIPAAEPLAVRDLRAADLKEVVRIEALHTGEAKPAHWKRVFREFLEDEAEDRRVALAVEARGRLLGFLLGEVRAFEFGSEPCGWVLSVAVDPGQSRTGVASSLLAEAHTRFRAMGIESVRTMVRRNDVPMLSFFRANGFVGGSFVQLELDLEGRT